jgi:uncharacterized protein YjfI (DUF2170 family)
MQVLFLYSVDNKKINNKRHFNKYLLDITKSIPLYGLGVNIK